MANVKYLKKVDPIQEGMRYAYGIRTGVRTAADFTIVLGFQPRVIRVANLTDRIEATHYVDAGAHVDAASDTHGLGAGLNAKSLLTIATGVRTYVAAGIALTADKLGFKVTVATAGLESDDDDCFWEAWG